MTADRYTHGHNPAVLASHSWRTAANSAAYLLQHLTPGMRVLDVGCGPGTITEGLAEAVAPGAVVGVDSAKEVIAEASRRYDGRSGLTFAVADTYRLPYPNASFDVVHAHQVLQHLTDPVAALREMRRVTKPGGLVAVRDADYSAMAYYPRLGGLQRFIEIYRSVARHNGGEPDAAPHLKHWAHQAGLTELTCTASAWCYATEAEVQWWSRTWESRVTASGIATTALEAGLATPAQLDECAQAWRTWGADPDAWFAVVSGEILARA